MEPLLEQLKSLPQKWNGLGRGTRLALLGAALGVAAIGGLAYVLSGGAESYQYAFTNLSPEDGQAASAVLKTSGIPFRVEAGGSALAVPASKVYDARLMLAAQGLPKAGGVGFELFDKGQFGVSEFTQRVNLRRAIEGELGRTVGNLAEVRAARVHLSLGERGLYRDEDKKPTASVVVTLHPGRSLSDAQLSGIRHLVASAVPGLSPDAVTIVDGHGAVLGEGAGSGATGAGGFEAQVEAQLQQRIVSLLEPVVGAGAVLARITATADLSEVSQQSEVFDPDQVALRSEKKGSSNQASESGANGGVAGAQGNQPLAAQAQGEGTRSKSTSGSQDDTRTYEISKTQTTTLIKTPRLRRLSVAVLLDAPKGVTRDEAELARLGDLVKKAIGFDEQRGDQFQISQLAFTRAENADAAPVASDSNKLPAWLPYAAGGAAFVVVVGLAFVLLRGKKRDAPKLVLKPGMKVAELEAEVSGAPKPELLKPAAELPKPAPTVAALPSPEAMTKQKAVELAKKDPVKTAQLIRAWIAADVEAAKEARRA